MKNTLGAHGFSLRCLEKLLSRVSKEGERNM